MSMEILTNLERVRSALFVPASNPRALAKAQTLAADMVVIDLEDAVRPEDKDTARTAAMAALTASWVAPLVGIRINGDGTLDHPDDLAMARQSQASVIVLPKVEDPAEASAVGVATQMPVIAMIETVKGVYAAREIASLDPVVGLMAGVNDLAADLRLPADPDRKGLDLALQMMVLAARAGGCAVLDGVYNRLDDKEGLARQCAEGRRLGFDGKTLIHPDQIDVVRQGFAPTAEELEDAQALIAAATGGAERFRNRMIEAMHVRAAERLIARSR